MHRHLNMPPRLPPPMRQAYTPPCTAGRSVHEWQVTHSHTAPDGGTCRASRCRFCPTAKYELRRMGGGGHTETSYGPWAPD